MIMASSRHRNRDRLEDSQFQTSLAGREFELGSFWRLELLGFGHEATALIEIYAPFARSAVGMVLSDFVFKAVTEIAAGIGMWNAQKIAKFRQEKLAVGTLGRAGLRPAGDERVGGLNRHDSASLKS